jgi:hypothetical protein
MTPTFAAGLGVVVAAVLAYQVGTPSFKVSMPRWNGQRCANAGCVRTPAKRGPASARKGQPIPHPTSPAAVGTPPARPAPAGGSYGPAGRRPVVAYQAVNSWSGGFLGFLTITFTNGHTPSHWWLRFSYPDARIQRVWGPVQWHPTGEHTAVISGTGGSGQWAGGQTTGFWFEAAGQAGKPHGCVFNGAACRIR